MRTFVLFVVLLGVAVPAIAVMTNQGVDRPLVQNGNVLSEGPRDNGRILYAPSEDDDPGFRGALAAITGGTVDYYDARFGTPTLAFLVDNYDCVYTWANYAYLDPNGFGNVLADFVDAGRHVVLGVFCAFTSGNFLSGRIMTAGYCPVIGGFNHFASSSYAGDGTTCIHNGVTYYDSFYRDILTPLGGGLVDGHYLDGEIGHAYRADYKVIYSNGSGALQLGGGGDWARLVSNSCACVPGPTPIENVTWGHIKTLYR